MDSVTVAAYVEIEFLPGRMKFGKTKTMNQSAGWRIKRSGDFQTKFENYVFVSSPNRKFYTRLIAITSVLRIASKSCFRQIYDRLVELV